MKKEKILPIITSLLVTLLVMLGTIVVFLYANGYRFNRIDGTVSKTGVLYITSSPYKTDIILNGKNIGKTPKTISSLKEGKHKIKLSREGYQDWEKELEIKAEKSTPVKAVLFKKDATAQGLFIIDNSIDSVTYSKDKNYVYLVSRNDMTDSSLYRIWRYNINPYFWEISQNPVLIYETLLSNVEKFEVIPSPNGKSALLTVRSLEIINGELPVAGSEPNTYYYNLNSGSYNEIPTQLDLSAYTNYEITWAEDSRHIMLSSANELISLDTLNQTKYIIRKDNMPSVWSTSKDGQIYFVDVIAALPEETIGDPETNNQDIDINSRLSDQSAITDTTATPSVNTAPDTNPGLQYQVTVSNMQGSDNTTIIDRIYTTTKLTVTNENFSNPSERELLQQTFTVTDEEGRLAGDIIEVVKVDEVDGYIITTTLATYMYYPEDNLFRLLLAEGSFFADLSARERMIILNGTSSVAVFVYDKEDADHTIQIGTQLIIDKDANEIYSNLNWIPETRFISYMNSEGRIVVVDSDGENKLDLGSSSIPFYLVNGSGNYIYTIITDLDSPNQSSALSRYQIQ